MKRTLRGALCLTAVAACAWLAAPAPARAQGVPETAGRVRSQERFVNMLLGRDDKAVRRQSSAINRQNQRIARGEALVNSGGSNSRLARINAGIVRLNNELQHGKFRIITLLGRTAQALGRMDHLMPVNPKIAAQLFHFERQANTRFGQQAAEAEGVINRPPATPVAANRAADVLGLSDPVPRHFAPARAADHVRHVTTEAARRR